MIVSEQEAASLWCPFARDAEENVGTFNRLPAANEQRTDADGVLLYVSEADPSVTGTLAELRAAGVSRFKQLTEARPVRPAPSCTCLGPRCMLWQRVGVDQGYCGMTRSAAL